MSPEEHRDLDQRTIGQLLITSTPEGRARLERDTALGRSTYDTCPSWAPRDRPKRCANPVCGLPFVASGANTDKRRYCSRACNVGAFYWRHRPAALSKRLAA